VLEGLVLQNNLRSLQVVLAVDDPKFPIQDYWPILLRGTGSEALWHHANCLPIPLNAVVEVVQLPLHTPAFPRSHYPLVGGFSTFEAVDVECEESSHGPTILRVTIEFSKDARCLRTVHYLAFHQRTQHDWR
jgi:hypothetical protein